MTTIAFIGMGTMGAPMARRLLQAGHDVVAANRSAPALRAFEEDGGRSAPSAADAAEHADVVVTMLPDSPDVRDVLLGDDGVLSRMRPSSLAIDMSTIDPAVSRELAEAAASRGVRALDAPVSGGLAGAREGTLSIMVGGDAQDVESARPILDAMGSTVVHVGPHGAGQTVKAANQFLVAGNLALVAEAIVFLERQGLDVDGALAVLAGGLAGSAVLQRKGTAMAARDFAPTFRAELHHKDIGIGIQAARSSGAVMPVSMLAGQYLASLVARGQGGRDHGAVLDVVAALSPSPREEHGPR